MKEFQELESNWACHQPREVIVPALRKPPMETTIRVNLLMWKIEDAMEAVSKMPGVPANSVTLHEDMPDIIVVKMADKNVEPVHTCVLVDTQCGEALLRGADVFAPGVITAKKVPIGTKVSVFAQVDDRKILRGSAIDDEIEEWIKTQVFVGNGQMEMDRAEVFRQNAGLSVKMVDGLTENICLMQDSLPPGLFPQNIPSCAASYTLDPQAGERVLDCCAGYGGKTSHIASLMGSGQIVAIDKSKRKAQDCANFLIREGIDFCKCKTGNATTFTDGEFDRVLVDVPCSATGIRPRLRFNLNGDIVQMAKYQRQILENAVRSVKEGGVVVYSTCSISHEENEENVRWALDTLPLMLEPCPITLGLPSVSPVLSAEERKCVQRFCPTGDTMGFFIARFRRRQC